MIALMCVLSRILQLSFLSFRSPSHVKGQHSTSENRNESNAHEWSFPAKQQSRLFLFYELRIINYNRILSINKIQTLTWGNSRTKYNTINWNYHKNYANEFIVLRFIPPFVSEAFLIFDKASRRWLRGEWDEMLLLSLLFSPTQNLIDSFLTPLMTLFNQI